MKLVNCTTDNELRKYCYLKALIAILNISVGSLT